MADQLERVRGARSGYVSRRALLRVVAALPIVSGVAARGMTARAASSTSVSAPVASPASPAASPAAAVTVKMTTQLRFDPPQVMIKAGQAVTWINNSPLPHTATGDPVQNPVNKSHPEYVLLPRGATPWGSKLLSQGERYTHTFAVAGEYKYICIPHVLSGMRGTVLVEE